MNEQTNINVEKLRPFTKLLMTIGELPTSYLMSMTYLEQVTWFCNYLQKTVIPVVNNNAQAVEELQNIINNLDIQDAVDTKLDEMAESGQLTDIIAQYLDLAGVLAYGSINEMANAENLSNGSICYTLGQTTYNDGKGAYYKIRQVTTGDVIDGINIVAITNDNTLIGERLSNYYINSINEMLTEINNKLVGYVTPQMFGAIGDGTTDDTEALQDAIDYVGNHPYLALYVPYGNYYITESLIVDFNEFSMIGLPRTEYHGRILVPNENFTAIQVKGYGAVFENIEIRCKTIFNATSGIPLANGISFYRDDDPTPDNNANIDCDVTSCQFFGLNVGIIGSGRNFDITECDFLLCNRGIEITYNSNQEMRDINIFHCRFHSIGENKSYTTDTCCIKMPDTANQNKQLIHQISSNFADYCSTFIKGSAYGLVVTNNIIWEAHNTQFDLIGNSASTGGQQVIQICNNSIRGIRVTDVTDRHVMETIIKAVNVFQMNISGNTFMNCYKEAINLNVCRNVGILNNYFESCPMNPEYMGLNTPTYNYMELVGGSNININGNISNPAFLSDNSTLAAAHVINRSTGSIRIGSNLMPRYGTFNQDSSFSNYSTFNDTIV